MGMIVIKTLGSFGETEQSFKAQDHGHADAIALAMTYLSTVLLPEATTLDHKLHSQGQEPSYGWERSA
jgi:hypothetical protein